MSDSTDGCLSFLAFLGALLLLYFGGCTTKDIYDESQIDPLCREVMASRVTRADSLRVMYDFDQCEDAVKWALRPMEAK